MKGAFLVADDPLLAEHVLVAMQSMGAKTTLDGIAQFVDQEGRMFTVFTSGNFEPEDDWRNNVDDIPHESIQVMRAANACWIECRWEELFSSRVRALGAELPVNSWVVDGDGVLWPVAEVDPARVRL